MYKDLSECHPGKEDIFSGESPENRIAQESTQPHDESIQPELVPGPYKGKNAENSDQFYDRVSRYSKFEFLQSEKEPVDIDDGSQDPDALNDRDLPIPAGDDGHVDKIDNCRSTCDDKMHPENT